MFCKEHSDKHTISFSSEHLIHRIAAETAGWLISLMGEEVLYAVEVPFKHNSHFTYLLSRQAALVSGNPLAHGGRIAMSRCTSATSP